MPYGCNYDSVIYTHRVSQLAKIGLKSKKDSPSFLVLPEDFDELSRKYCEYPLLYRSLSGQIEAKSRSMLIASPISPKIYRYSYANDTWNYCGDMGSYLFNGKIKTTDYWTKDDDIDDLYSHRLSEFVYNEGSGLYFRLMRVSKIDTTISMEDNYPFCTLSVYDQNFVKLGEAPLEFRALDYFIVPYKNGVLLRDQLESDRKHKIVLRYIKFSGSISRKTGWLSSKLDSIRKQEASSYIPNLAEYLTDSANPSGSYLLIPLQNSCPACLEELTEFMNFIALSDSGKKSNIHLILLSMDQYSTDKFIRRLNDKTLATFNIQVDKTTRYLQYTQKWVNLRLLVVDNNSVTFDRVYDPGELEDLFLLIRQSMN